MTKDERVEYNKKYRQDNRDKLAAYYKKYRLDNKDKLAAQDKKYYLDNRDKIAARKKVYIQDNKETIKSYSLQKQYGITLAEYDLMVLAQNGICAICGLGETAIDPRTGQIKRLSVDHNHQTNKVRELLCTRCNTALGLLKDSPELCHLSELYLIKHKNLQERKDI